MVLWETKSAIDNILPKKVILITKLKLKLWKSLHCTKLY